MKINEAITICKNFVNIDRTKRKGNVTTPYEKFCESICEAMETLIKEVQLNENRTIEP